MIYPYTGNNFIFGMYGTNVNRKEIIEREIVLQKKLTKILNQLKKEPKAQIFLQRVTKREAPNYFDIIKKPMDLGTMSKKINLYRDMKQFKDDLDLIWSNCLTYNVNGEYFRDCAISMSRMADELCLQHERVFPSVLISEKKTVKNKRVHPKEEVYNLICGYIKEVGFDSINPRALTGIFDFLNEEIKKGLKYTEDV